MNPSRTADSHCRRRPVRPIGPAAPQDASPVHAIVLPIRRIPMVCPCNPQPSAVTAMRLPLSFPTILLFQTNPSRACSRGARQFQTNPSRTGPRAPANSKRTQLYLAPVSRQPETNPSRTWPPAPANSKRTQAAPLPVPAIPNVPTAPGPQHPPIPNQPNRTWPKRPPYQTNPSRTWPKRPPYQTNPSRTWPQLPSIQTNPNRTRAQAPAVPNELKPHLAPAPVNSKRTQAVPGPRRTPEPNEPKEPNVFNKTPSPYPPNRTQASQW